MKLRELAESKTLPPGVCKVCSAARVMDADTLLYLVSVLKNRNKAYTLIAESLVDEGFEGVSASSVAKHAKGECSGNVRYR